MFLSSQPWTKKKEREIERLGKRQALYTCTSHVASGVEMAKLRRHLRSVGHCHTFAAGSRVA